MKICWGNWRWGRSIGLGLLLLAALPVGAARATDDYSHDPFDPAIARDAWGMISAAEKRHQIPSGLLHAMSLVETGQGVRGWMLPWPYTVGVNGTGKKTFRSATEAARQLQHWRSLGFVRFDVSVNGRMRTNQKSAEAAAQLAALGSSFGFISLEGRNFARRFNGAAETERFLQSMFARGYRNMDVGMMQINWKVHGKYFRDVTEVLEPTNNLAYAVRYLLEHRQTRDWWGSVGRYHSGTARYASRYIKNVYSMYMRIHRANNNA